MYNPPETIERKRSRLIPTMFGYASDLTRTIGDACRRYLTQHNPDHCFYWFLGFLGGRGYNQFLDYGLLLLKVSQYFKGIMWNGDFLEEYTKTIADLYHFLMFDDRHDLWQNLPYALDKMIPGFSVNDEDSRDMGVYLKLCEMLIECINEDGTGDGFS